MDPVSHVAATALAASAFVRREKEKWPLIGVAVAAGLAPDLDALSLLGGFSAYARFHQSVTHNLFVVPLLVLLVAWVFRRLGADAGFLTLLGFGALGAIGHLLLDLTITWGWAPFWPLSGRTYCLSLVSLTDPLFLLLCGGACYAIFHLDLWHMRRRLAAAILPSLFLYFFLRFLFLVPR